MDDFNILTGNKIQHQKNQEKATSMGLIFKPKKCRTYSVCTGKPTPVTFTLSDGNTQLPNKIELKTLIEDPHNFFGQIITHKNSSQDHFDYMHDILKRKLENLDRIFVRKF